MGVLADYPHLGDPEEMEALASELLLRAESVAGVAGSLSRQVRGMTFEGPAADRLRDEMEERRRRAERVAAELQETAHTLRRSASAVREQIHELRLAEQRLAERGDPE